MLGYWMGSAGQYDLTGTGVLAAGGATLWVGVHGAGGFTHDGPGTSVEVARLHIGWGGAPDGGNVGSYTLHDGQLTAGTIAMDHGDGSATLSQGGGTADVAGDLEMSAHHNTGHSTYWLIGTGGGGAGGTLNVAGDITGGLGDSRLYLLGGELNMTGGGSISVRRLYVGASGGTTYTQTGGEDVTAGRAMYVGDYVPGGPAGGTYNMASTGTLSVGGFLYVGLHGTGLLNQTAGTVEGPSKLILGGHPAGSGAYHLQGAASRLEAGCEIVGLGSTGEFTHDDGTNAVRKLILAQYPGATGTYTLNGGLLDSNSGPPGGGVPVGWQQYVGYRGGGAFHHNGGVNDVDVLRVGFNGAGQYNLNVLAGDGNDLRADWLLVGNRWGSGEFNHAAGTVAAGEVRLVGYVTDANYTLAGGSLNVGAMLVEGPRARFNQRGGQVRVGGGNTLVVEGEAVYRLDTGDLTADVEEIGALGAGTFRQSGGTNTTGKLYLGRNPFPIGTYFNSFAAGHYLKTGGVLEVTGDQCAYIGFQGTALMEHTAGLHALNGSLHVGYGAGADGTYRLSGPARLDANTAVRVGSGPGQAGVGRFEWLGAGAAIDTPVFALGPKGTLAMGFSFALDDVLSGTLFGSGTASVQGMGLGTLEVLGGATATQAGGSRVLGGLRVGPDANGGTYTHAGGQLAAGCVEIGPNAVYQFTSGGSLDITGGGLHLAGEMQCNGHPVTLHVQEHSLLHLTGDNFTGKSGLTVNVDANTLTFFDPGSDPFLATMYYNSGREHPLGSTLNVYSYQSYTFAGHVPDPVDVHGGSILATPNRAIHLNGGLTLGGGGTVDLGLGSLTCDANGPWGNHGSTLRARHACVGKTATVGFDQNGGTTTIDDTLCLGQEASAVGTWRLDGGGALQAGSIVLGRRGRGVLQNHDGNVTIAYELILGEETGSSGEYVNYAVTTNIISGLVQKCATVGRRGTGLFVQIDGGVAIGGRLALGAEPGSDGTYVMHAGQLEADELCVGLDGVGTLDIRTSSVDIRVQELLSFGPAGCLLAPPGTSIRMIGADLDIRGTSPADLAGLANLTLLFETDGNETASIEAAGEDRGRGAAAWTDNFALQAIAVGHPLGGAARARLVDHADNHPAGDEDEALYLGTLNVGLGSALDLNGLSLYAKTSITQQGALELADGTIGGTPISNTGTITGSGTIDANLTNLWEIRPGGSAGTIRVRGDYFQTPIGTLALELAGRGADDFDRLLVEGTAQLQGALAISLWGGFVPTCGDSFQIVDSNGLSGRFGTVTGFILTPTKYLAVDYDANSVTATATFPGDADIDGDVDYEDYKKVLMNFIQIPAGKTWRDSDYDYDGDVDYEDYKKILQNFGSTWTGGGLAEATGDDAQLPEPATVLLLLVGLPLLGRRRRG